MARFRSFWSDPTWRPRAYFTLVVGGGAAVLAGALYDVYTGAGPAGRLQPAVLWLLVGLVVLGEARPVLSRRNTDGASLGLAFAAAVYALDGWREAVLAQALAMLLAEVGRRHTLDRIAFNVCQQAISYFAGAFLFSLLVERNGGSAGHGNVLGPARVSALMV